MKCVVVVDAVYLYYIIVSGVVRFEVRVIFFVQVFFVVIFYGVKVDFYNCEFFIFFFRY